MRMRERNRADTPSSSAATKLHRRGRHRADFGDGKSENIGKYARAVNSKRVSFLDRPTFISRSAAWSLLPQRGFFPLLMRIRHTKAVSNSGMAKISNGARKPRLECSLYPVSHTQRGDNKASRVLPLSPRKVLTRLLWL